LGLRGKTMEADFSQMESIANKKISSGLRHVDKSSKSANQETPSLAAALTGSLPVDETKERIVHFPHDRSAGDLYLLDAKGRTNFIGQALGEVHVPADAQLYLYYNYDQVYGCSRLARLASDALYGLSFLGTEIADPDLQFLSHLDALQELDISCTSLSDQCLAHLEKLPNLSKLNLSSTKVTAKGSGYLYRLKGLTELILDDTYVGDQALLRLCTLNRLETLSLSFTKVSSRGLAKIKSLKQLKRLRLNSTNVSNAGIDFLIKLTKLEELWLRSTRVTHRGLGELRKSLPNCQIIF